MKSLKPYFPYIALATASIIWGANTPIMKLTIASVPLFSLGFLRFFLASLLLLPFVYKNLSIQRKDWFALFLNAFIGITVLITLYFLGLKMTTALNSGIIGGTLPMITIIFAWVFLHEKLTKRILIGSIISLLGLFVIVGKDLFSVGFDVSPMGDTLIFLSNIAFAVYDTFSKELSRKYAPLTLTFYTFFIGSLFFLPGVFSELKTNPVWYVGMPTGAYLGILYGIIFSGLAAFSLWQYGLSKVSETQVGLFFYISPFVSSVIAIAFLGDNLTEEFIMGSLLICIGLLVAQAHTRHKRALHH